MEGIDLSRNLQYARAVRLQNNRILIANLHLYSVYGMEN